MAAESFQGGVDHRRAGRGERRARIAIHGSNVEALTGDETFRIPVARCSLARDGQKILVRDEQGALAIWSDDEGFLDALERAQRGALREQVRRIRGADRRRRALKLSGKALVAAAALYAASVPVTRWAVGSGVPTIADHLGSSALNHLNLPSSVAPKVEQRLGHIAEQLRPASSLSTRSFRILLADYADVHSFSLPPDVVIVTSGLVCGAAGPELVTAAVARELAHLEKRDVSHRVAEAVDWRTPLDLALGDFSELRDRMLDFADAKRSPGFTPAQETAANDRALAIMKWMGVAPAAGQDLATITAQLKEIRLEAEEDGQPTPSAGEGDALGWSEVRAEACDVIGR